MVTYMQSLVPVLELPFCAFAGGLFVPHRPTALGLSHE